MNIVNATDLHMQNVHKNEHFTGCIFDHNKKKIGSTVSKVLGTQADAQQMVAKIIVFRGVDSRLAPLGSSWDNLCPSLCGICSICRSRLTRLPSFLCETQRQLMDI